jgi:hypothetical protein
MLSSIASCRGWDKGLSTYFLPPVSVMGARYWPERQYANRSCRLGLEYKGNLYLVSSRCPSLTLKAQLNIPHAPFFQGVVGPRQASDYFVHPFAPGGPRALKAIRYLENNFLRLRAYSAAALGSLQVQFFFLPDFMLLPIERFA